MATVATYAAVAIAAETLTRQGENPTVSAVINVLKGGSSTTVHKHLKQWREEKAKEAEQDPLPNELLQAIQKVWGQTQEQADQIYAVQQDEWQSATTEWDAERTALSARIAELESAQREHLENQQRTDNTCQALSAERDALIADRDHLRQRLTVQDGQLEALRQERVDSEQAQQALVATIKDDFARHHEALKQSAADGEVHLSRQLDDERQRTKTLEQRLARLEQALTDERQARSDGLMVLNDTHQQALNALHDQVASERAGKAHAEGAEQVRAEQMAQFDARIETLTTALQTATVTAAQLDDRSNRLAQENKQLLAAAAKKADQSD